MLYYPDRIERLDALLGHLKDTAEINADLIYCTLHECERLAASRQSRESAWISRLIADGAWIDAVLAIISAELPQWMLRRAVYDDGDWYCAISRHREMPDWLDRSIEAHHASLPAAALMVFIEALREKDSAQEKIHTTRVSDNLYELVCCDNFA